MGFLTGRRAKATLLLRLAIFIKKMLDKFKKFVIIYLDKEKGCIKTAKPLANLFDRALKRSGFYGV